MSWSRVLRGVFVTGKPNFELIEQLILILFYIVYFRSSEWHKFIATQTLREADAFGGISHNYFVTITKIARFVVALASLALKQGHSHLLRRPGSGLNQYMSSVETIATYSANDFSVMEIFRRRSGSTRRD